MRAVVFDVVDVVVVAVVLMLLFMLLVSSLAPAVFALTREMNFLSRPPIAKE